MTAKVITATPDMTLVEAAKLMNKYRIGGLPVVRGGELAGIITERDIMQKAVAQDKRPAGVKVKELMVKKDKLVTNGKFDDIGLIAQNIAKHDLTRIPILHEGKLVGIVTNRDVLKHSTEHMAILLEQARIKGPGDIGPHYPLAHGKCDRCGAAGNLTFRDSEFLCELCP